jgi:hypothetical protein
MKLALSEGPTGPMGASHRSGRGRKRIEDYNCSIVLGIMENATVLQAGKSRVRIPDGEVRFLI